MKTSLLSTALLVSFVLMLGRVSGFFRETILAASLGPTARADAAIIILTLPDFMLGLLLAGGFGAALIPALMQGDAAARMALLRRVSIWIFGLFAALAMGLAMWPSFALSQLAPSLQIDQTAGAVAAFQISLLALPIVAMVGVAAAYLNVKGRFAAPNISVLVFNVTIIAFLLFVYADLADGLWGFAVTIVVATLLRLGLHLALMPEVFTAQPRVDLPGRAQAGAGRSLALNFVIGTLGYSILVGAPVVFRTLHAGGGDGALALFNFAQKLFELPSAMLIAPFVTIFLPLFARIWPQKDQRAFDDTLVTGLVGAFALGAIAAALGFGFLGYFAQIVYLYGAMTGGQVAQIAQLGAVFLASLPMLAAAQISLAALNATARPRRGMLWGAVSLAAACLAYYGLRALPLPAHLAPAALAYGLFHLFLAITLTADALPAQAARKRAAAQILIIVMRSAIGIAPFLAITQLWLTDLTRWQGILLALPALAVQIWLLRAQIMPLARLRIAKT